MSKIFGLTVTEICVFIAIIISRFHMCCVKVVKWWLDNYRFNSTFQLPVALYSCIFVLLSRSIVCFIVRRKNISIFLANIGEMNQLLAHLQVKVTGRRQPALATPVYVIVACGAVDLASS